MSETALYAVLTDFKGMAETEVTVILRQYNYIKFDEKLINRSGHSIIKTDVYTVLKAFIHEDAEYNIGDYWTCRINTTQLSDDEA